MTVAGRVDPAEMVAAPDQSNPFNPVLWLVAALWQARWLVVAVAAAGTLAAAVVAERMPDRFTAAGLLEIDPDRGRLVGDRTAGTTFVTPETVTETEAQVMRSAGVIARVVDRLDLEYGAGPLVDASIPAGREGSRAALVAAIGEGLTVTPTGRSFIVELAFTAREPALAAEVVNAVMAEYLGAEVGAERALSREAVALLSDRLEDLSADLDARERAVQDFRASSRVAEGAGTTILVEQLTRLNEELIRAQAALALASASSGQRGGGSPEALPEVVASPLITELRAQAAVQERAVSELEALYRPEHPRLVQARGALDALRGTIAAETQKIAQSLGTTERVESERVATLEREVETLRDRLNAQREAEIELRRLEREVEASRRVYEAFLNRFNEVQGETGLERPDGRVIAAAVPPVAPSGPNRLLVVAGGGIASSALAFALAVGLALLDGRARTPADVARATGLTPVAVVPPVPDAPRGLLRRPGRARRNAAFADAITHLRAALLLGGGAPAPMVIAFVAADRDADAASLATAFAQASAIAGDAVVLMDADFRRPAVHERLGGGNEYGLAEAVTHQGDIETALQTDPATPLLYVAAGRAPVEPSAYRSRLMGSLLDHLARHFDVIVLALPPILEAPDAQGLAAEADITALVADGATARRAPLTEAALLLRHTGAGRRLATVLIRP